MGILHGEQMISKPTQCYEISELIQALGIQTDLTHIILLESEVRFSPNSKEYI